MNSNKNQQNFFQKNKKLILISLIFVIAISCFFYNRNINDIPLVQSGGKIISNKFVINNITELNNLLDSF